MELEERVRKQEKEIRRKHRYALVIAIILCIIWIPIAVHLYF